MKAVLTVQPERELAADVHPHRHMMAIPWRRVVLRQLVHDLLSEEELKELGFGDVRGQFDVIEATLAKLIDHPRLVVLEDDQIHESAPAGRTRLLQRRGRTQFSEHGFALLDTGGLQSIDEFEQLPLPAHELGAGLPAAAIVKGHRS